MSEMEKKSTAPDKSWLQRAAESEFFHNYKRSPSAIIGTAPRCPRTPATRSPSP